MKTAIVTGGSQGIGAGVVKAFLDRGYNVVANSRNITKSRAFEASDKLGQCPRDECSSIAEVSWPARCNAPGDLEAWRWSH
jgi:NAD(P)-dependent dehydrogenase (short-subunit alcohol dehydrogenase family)